MVLVCERNGVPERMEFPLVTENFKFFDYDKATNTIIAWCFEPLIAKQFFPNDNGNSDIMLVVNGESTDIVITKPIGKYDLKSMCFHLEMSTQEKRELYAYLKPSFEQTTCSTILR